MSDSPSKRLVKLLNEGSSEGWYAHMAVRMYDLLREAYGAGYSEGRVDEIGDIPRGLHTDRDFEEWMSSDGE